MERLTRSLLVGVGLGLVLVACSSFSYKWYVVDLELEKLNGPKPGDDLPLARCEKQNDEYQCVAMTIDEFTKMRRDFASMQERLKRCPQ